ncbi:hypothetical protein [Afipia sp. 1NLS2]
MPSLHELAALLQGVTTSVRTFRLVSDEVRKCRFRDLSRERSGIAGPVPK